MAPKCFWHGRSPEDGSIFFRQKLRLAIAAANYVKRLARGEQCLVAVTKNFIGESNGAVSRLRNACAHAEYLVIESGGVVVAAHVDNHDMAVVLDFHALVLDAPRAHQLYAANFEPNQVIRVVDHAHLIGFRVAHSYRRVVMLHGLHDPDYSGLPCQIGLRFSRKEATPSLKSGVQRIRAFSRIARSRS